MFTLVSRTAPVVNPPAHSMDSLPQPPVEILIKDSPRVQAALNLSEAIKDLAHVIRGHVVEVSISDCHFNCTGGKSAIHIDAELA